ncbi:hypothetical protein [Vibrio sp. TBV020]|uniref:hypothetical protein n=1 Tax=Vibrio sp. TBV020 TaxID=3137398 RepID=UPI0038CD5EAA
MRAIPFLKNSIAISTLSFLLAGCNLDSNGNSVSDSENNFTSSNMLISSKSDNQFLPSTTGQLVTYTLRELDGTPISHQKVNLAITGHATFGETQAVIQSSGNHSQKPTLTVQTDENGEFSAHIYATATGEFTLTAYIDNELILSDSYLVSNLNQDGSPAIAVTRLSVVGNINPVIADFASPTKVTEIAAYDAFDNLFSNANLDHFVVSADNTQSGYSDIKATISTNSGNSGNVLVSAYVDTNASATPSNNTLAVTYDPTPDAFGQPNGSGDEVEIQVALTFETLPAEANDISDFISNNLDTIGGTNGSVELMKDESGVVIGVTVHDPDTQQVSEVKNVQVTDEEKSKAVNALPDAVTVDPDADSTTLTQFESVTKDENGNIVSNSVTTTIEFDDGASGTQTATVVETVKESASLELNAKSDDADLTLLDNLTGRVEETQVTLPDGTVTKETTVTSVQPDGSEITAQHSASTNGSESSIAGTLTGEVESVTVTQKDASGEVLQEQTLSTGKDVQGNDVIATSDYQSNGVLQVDGEVVAGAVDQSSVQKTDDQGTQTSEQVAAVTPNGRGDLIIAPPSTTIVPDGIDKGDVAPQNVPVNGNATDATVNALATVFERNYGIDFDGWDINKRVVTYIMRDVMDYDAMLTMLKNKQDDSLKQFMQNYPMSSTNGFITVLSVAGQHKTLVMVGNKDDETKKELVFDSRPKQWQFMANMASEENGFQFPRNMLLSLDDGRTYIIKNGDFVDPTSNINDAGLGNNAYGTDDDGNVYLKNSVSMGYAARQHRFNLDYANAVLLLQPTGSAKKILCVPIDNDISNQCSRLNALNDGSVTWLDLFNQPESLEGKNLGVTVEGEYGNKIFALNNEGTFYLQGYHTDFFPGIQASKDSFDYGSINGGVSWIRTGDKIYVTGKVYGFDKTRNAINIDQYKVSGKTYDYLLSGAKFTQILTEESGSTLHLVANDGNNIYLKGQSLNYVYHTNGYPSRGTTYPTVTVTSEDSMDQPTAYLTASPMDEFRNLADKNFAYILPDEDGNVLDENETNTVNQPYKPAINLDGFSTPYKNLCVLDKDNAGVTDFSLCSDRYVLGVEAPTVLPTVVQRFVDQNQSAGWKENTLWGECKSSSSDVDTSGPDTKAHIPCDYDNNGTADDGFRVLPYSTTGDTSTINGQSRLAEENFSKQVTSTDDLFGYYLPVVKVYGKGDSTFKVKGISNDFAQGITPLVYVLADGGILVGVDYLSINSTHYSDNDGINPDVVQGDKGNEYATPTDVFAELLEPTDDLNSIAVNIDNNPPNSWRVKAYYTITIRKDDKEYVITRSNTQAFTHENGNDIATAITVNARTDGYDSNAPSTNTEKPKAQIIAEKLLDHWNATYQTNRQYRDIVESGSMQWSYRFKDGSLALFDTLVDLDPEGDSAQPLTNFEDFVGKKFLASLRLDDNFTGLSTLSVLKFENGLYWPYAKEDTEWLRMHVTYFLNQSPIKLPDPATGKDGIWIREPDQSVYDELNNHNNDYWKANIYGLHLNPDYVFGSLKKDVDSLDYYLSFYADKNNAGFYDFNVFSTINRNWVGSPVWQAQNYWNRLPTSDAVLFFDEDGNNRFYDSQGDFVVDNVISVTPHLGYWVTALAFYHYDSGNNQFTTQMVTTQESDYTSDCLNYILGKSEATCSEVITAP